MYSLLIAGGTLLASQMCWRTPAHRSVSAAEISKNTEAPIHAGKRPVGLLHRRRSYRNTAISSFAVRAPDTGWGTAPHRERLEDQVGFGVSEYTLVFKRLPDRKRERVGHTWLAVRPAVSTQRATTVRSEVAHTAGVAHILVVPICSTLALDTLTYEAFLVQSGVIDKALRLLASMTLGRPTSVEMTRRQIQSLVMAAEVQHIVDGMSA